MSSIVLSPPQKASELFTHSSAGHALFFRMGGHTALRVESATLGLEFVDKTWLGSDPNGDIYYNSLSDLEQLADSKYRVASSEYQGIKYAMVYFFYEEADKPDELTAYAWFVGELRRPDQKLIEPYEGTGKWAKLQMGTTSAKVSKRSINSRITLSAKAISKGATWEAPADSLKPKSGFDVDGILSFKNESDIKTKGLIANYNNDRIVFYDSPHSFDFVAYFIPLDSEHDSLDYKGGADDVEMPNVTWN